MSTQSETWSSRGQRCALVVLLVCSVVLIYLGWMGWCRPVIQITSTSSADPYTAGEVIGTIVTVAVLAAAMAVATGQSRFYSHVAFWSLFAVNCADMGLRPTEDANMWLVSAVMFGPIVWGFFYGLALLLDNYWQPSTPPWKPLADDSVRAAAVSMNADQQIATWRSHRKAMTGE